MSITPIILTLGIIIGISSFVIPLILKLMNKKDGKFRSNFFTRGIATGLGMSLCSPLFQSISIRVALEGLKTLLLSVIIFIGFLAALGIIIYLIIKFDNWLEKDKS